MHSRAGLFVVVVLLAAVGVVQWHDPALDARTAPSVDFSAPPAEVAADAARQFEHVNYAYRIDLADHPAGEWRQVRRMRVDHDERRYWKTGPIDTRGVTLFGTDAVTFVRPGNEATWRVTADPETVYPAETISQPFLVDSIEAAGAVETSRDGSRVIVDLDTNPLRLVRSYPGSATIAINESTGMIETAVVRYHTRGRGTRYLRFRLVEAGVSVGRPADLPISPREFVWDLLRGPIVTV